MADTTKADLIRRGMQKYPDLSTSELAKKLSDDHPGKNIRPQEISAVKARLRRDEVAQTTPPPSVEVREVEVEQEEEPTAPLGISKHLAVLKALVKTYGKDELKDIIDLLD